VTFLNLNNFAKRPRGIIVFQGQMVCTPTTFKKNWDKGVQLKYTIARKQKVKINTEN
jgi:hypothetical protein